MDSLQSNSLDPLGGPNGDDTGPSISIRQLLVILWAYRILIAVVIITVVAAAGAALKFLVPQVYAATATLLVASKEADPVAGPDSAQTNSWSFMGTQVELIQSMSTLIPVVDKLKLTEKAEYVTGYRGDGSADSLRQFAAGRVWKKLTVTPGQSSRFIYVSADDRDPVMAATLANAVADSYLEEQMRYVMEPAKDRIERYSGQLETLRKNVEQAQAKVSEFRKKTGLIDLTEKTDLDSTRLNDLATRLTEATAERQTAEQRLARVSRADQAVLSSPLVQTLKAQLQTNEAQLSELSGSLGPRHPQIVSLRAEMEQLRAQLNREIGVHVESAQAEVNAARAIESQLRAQMNEQRDRVMRTRTMQDDGSSLLQELESATKVYQGALDAFERAQLGTQMAASNVTLANRAAPPSLPKPGRKKKFAMAVVFAFGLGFGGALLLGLMDRRVRCREDVENELRVPVLAELKALG